MQKYTFEWDDEKARANQKKHGVLFETAQYAFYDEKRIIAHDEKHSAEENRWFCIGRINDEVITVRFTTRGFNIRIIGAGIWKKWTKYYEKENDIHR